MNEWMNAVLCMCICVCASEIYFKMNSQHLPDQPILLNIVDITIYVIIIDFKLKMVIICTCTSILTSISLFTVRLSLKRNICRFIAEYKHIHTRRVWLTIALSSRLWSAFISLEYHRISKNLCYSLVLKNLTGLIP